MALPTSGPISINDLIAEFGGNGAMFSYYRGGSLVPDTPANSGVPTSGAISLFDFYGAAAAAYGTDDLLATSFGPSNVHATIFVNTDGSVGFTTGSNGHSEGEHWYIPPTSGIGNSHWVRLTGSGNTPAGSALNSWLALSSGRSWGLSLGSPGSLSFDGTLQIATNSSGSNVVATRSFGLAVTLF